MVNAPPRGDAAAAPPDPGDVDTYLGAARVVRVEPAAVVVALEEARGSGPVVVHATPALTVPYAPRPGDQLLVIGDAAAFYVIGVLDGRGAVSLSNPAGVALRAEGGALRVVGDRGVRVAGARVRLETGWLRQLAVSAVTTFGERVTHVREAWKVEAGQLDERSDGRHLLQARRAVIKALTSARIKSTTVRVG